MGHRLVLVAAPVRRSDTSMTTPKLVHVLTLISYEVMTEAEANRFITELSEKLEWDPPDPSSHWVPIQVLSVEYCNVCAVTIHSAVPRRDHSGRAYCGEVCWEAAWQ